MICLTVNLERRLDPFTRFIAASLSNVFEKRIEGGINWLIYIYVLWVEIETLVCNTQNFTF